MSFSVQIHTLLKGGDYILNLKKTQTSHLSAAADDGSWLNLLFNSPTIREVKSSQDRIYSKKRLFISPENTLPLPTTR